MKEFVKSITSPYEKELIETRRYLHRHPDKLRMGCENLCEG